MFSNGPSRSNRLLATQFSRHTACENEILLLRLGVNVVTRAKDDFFRHGLHACREVHVSLFERDSGCRGGPPKARETAARSWSARRVVEVPHVQAETAVSFRSMRCL